jgi:hypothetical protein
MSVAQGPGSGLFSFQGLQLGRRHVAWRDVLHSLMPSGPDWHLRASTTPKATQGLTVLELTAASRPAPPAAYVPSSSDAALSASVSSDSQRLSTVLSGLPESISVQHRASSSSASPVLTLPGSPLDSCAVYLYPLTQYTAQPYQTSCRTS